MASAADIVAQLKTAVPGLSGTRLQKLLFYADVWSQVWDGEPLFAAEFEAWREGPVLREAWVAERQQPVAPGAAELSPSQRATLEAVVALYGRYSGEWLSRLTHRELPWRRARVGLSADAAGTNPVRRADIAEYYGAAGGPGPKLFSDAYRRGLELLVELPEAEIDLMAAEPLGDDESRRFITQLETGEEQ